MNGNNMLGKFIVVAGLLLIASSASAQTYGAVTLTPGGGSQMLSGMSGGIVGAPGGELDASVYGVTCRGWIAATPDHTLTLTAQQTVDIAVASTDGGDTAMVMVGPGGTYCNDDSVGLNPGLAGSFMAGTYSIWIGSYAMGTNHPYTITFTDYTAAVPIPVPTGPVIDTTGLIPVDAMGTIYLTTGFLPDPQSRTGTIVGTVDMNTTANMYGGTCRGYVQYTPSHIMTLNSAFAYLRVHVRSAADTTMIIQDPAGGYWCNDDADGFNPVIEGPWSAGTWRIWIGTYSPSNTATYSVEFTEYPR